MYIYSVVSHTRTIWGFLSAYRGGGWFEVYLICMSTPGQADYTRLTGWNSRYIKVREGNGMVKDHYIWRKDGAALVFSPVPQQFVPEEVRQLRIALQQEGYQDLIH